MASSSRDAPILPLRNGLKSPGGRTPSPVTPNHTHPPLRTPSSMYQRMSNRDKVSGKDDFYSNKDIGECAPRGLASLAAHQMYYPNMNSMRRYGWLSQMIRLDYQFKLEDASNRLFGLEVEIVEESLQSDQPQPQPSTPPCQTTPPASRDGETRYQQREMLMAQSKQLYKEYQDFVLAEREIQRLPRVSRRTHQDHYRQAEGWLSEEQREVFRYMDDFITIDPDTTYTKFEPILYSKNYVVHKFLRFMSGLFGQKKEAPGPNDFHTEHGARMFKWTVKIVLALACCVLFLAPVGILYLVDDLTQGGLYGVTVGFSVVFVFIMVVSQDRIGPMLLGNGAYMAVMVVFLSNVNQGIPR